MGLFDAIFRGGSLKKSKMCLEKGQWELSRKNYWDAASEFDSAVIYDPQNIAAWDYRAMMFEKLGYLIDAAESYRQAESLGKNNGDHIRDLEEIIGLIGASNIIGIPLKEIDGHMRDADEGDSHYIFSDYHKKYTFEITSKLLKLESDGLIKTSYDKPFQTLEMKRKNI